MIKITNSHKRGFWRGGQHHPQGDKLWPIETFSAEQLALVEADTRLAVAAAGNEAHGQGRTGDEVGSAEPGVDRRALIFAAIQALDPEDRALWTSKNVPQVAALEGESGLADISAQERDELWAEYQEIQEGAA